MHKVPAAIPVAVGKAKAAGKRKLLTATIGYDTPTEETIIHGIPAWTKGEEQMTAEQLEGAELSRRREAAVRRLVYEELPSWTAAEREAFNSIKDRLPIDTLYDEARNKYGGDVGRVIGVIRSDIQNLVGDKRSNAAKKPHPPKRAKTEEVVTEQKRGKPAPPVPARSEPNTPQGSPEKMFGIGQVKLFDLVKSKMERRRISIEPNDSSREHTGKHETKKDE